MEAKTTDTTGMAAAASSWRVERAGPEFARAYALGLSHEGLNRLRSLLDERGRNAWAVGDLLVEVYGPPRRDGHDGSTTRLRMLAEDLGCSWSWLAACRTASAAWPRRERKATVAWSVSRHLASRPDRIALLASFLDACARERVTPSLARLVSWLDGRDLAPTAGRPRRDPLVRVERMALALDRDDLARLVARLVSALSQESDTEAA